MGDIAQTENNSVNLNLSVHARSPIERIDILNAMDTVATIRNPAESQGADRLRVLWRGAMVKGRGARATWRARAIFDNCRILETREINAWNPDRVLTHDSENTLSWESVTAGNFGAFDVWLDESDDARIHLETGHVDTSLELGAIGREDTIIPAGGLDLEIRLFRLPASLQGGPISASLDVPVHGPGDNPLWIRVTTEDGFQAWTSPVYLFKK
jgi:hypothetical protein